MIRLKDFATDRRTCARSIFGTAVSETSFLNGVSGLNIRARFCLARCDINEDEWTKIEDLVNSDIDSGDCITRSGIVFSYSCKTLLMYGPG